MFHAERPLEAAFRTPICPSYPSLQIILPVSLGDDLCRRPLFPRPGNRFSVETHILNGVRFLTASLWFSGQSATIEEIPSG